MFGVDQDRLSSPLRNTGFWEIYYHLSYSNPMIFMKLGEMTDADNQSFRKSATFLGAIRQTSGYGSGLIRKYGFKSL